MSSETKWTPGPWEVEPRDSGSGAGINGPNGEAVVWWAGEDEHDNGIGSEHDAHLIAAAPELYAAIEGALGDVTDMGAKQAMLDALAKARGEKS